MRPRYQLSLSLLCAALLLLAGCDQGEIPTAAEEPAPPSESFAAKNANNGGVIPGQYIVVFKDDVVDPAAVANGIAQTNGLGLRHTYTAALKGFAAIIPSARLDAVRNDPRIRYIVPDQVDQIYAQTPPTGIDRIEADLNTRDTATDPVNVDIAIIDTGIDLDHPDLNNVVVAVSFVNGGNGNDKNGHGTHVAGTAAANGSVVGVAPGARLHAVQVCKPGGLCFRSDIIAGIDYVTENAAVIAVANMSLGGSGSDDGNCGLTNNDPEHEAICNAVVAGVVFVVSAGNSSADAANSVPAAYDEVITVSALADFDGKAGGAGAPTCRTDEDDSFASFSNFGADVDLMAPGVCIESTWNDGGTNTISGTSMSSPHVTGTVALYIALNGRATDLAGVLAIRAALVADGITQDDPDCGLSTFDDPDGIAEPIVFANATNVGGDGSCEVAGPPAPATLDITTTSPPDGTVNEAYSATLEATGGTPPYSWAITAGALPAGLSLDMSTGEIFGTPTTEGSQIFTVEVTDVEPATDTQELSIAITAEPPVGTAPVVDLCAPDAGSPGDKFVVAVTGSGFQNGAAVDFGEKIMVQRVTFISSSQLDVEIKVHPKAVIGSRNVTVTNPDGLSGVKEGCFTVDP